VECLFFNTSLVQKHKVILDKIQWCHSLQGWTTPSFTPTTPDALSPSILNAMGEPTPTPHGVYVDEDIYLDVTDRQSFEQATAVGIEAIPPWGL
jgi:hypothetical protein